MKKIRIIMLLLGYCLVSTSFGHLVINEDQEMAYGDDPIVLTHTDEDQTKGNQKGEWILTITNTGIISWTDFHFQISFGNAFFEDSGDDYPLMQINGVDAVFTDALSADGKEWDLFFETDPVETNETVVFTLYTNNQTDGGLFGICFWPTPEPATLALLGLGSLAMLRRRK